MIEPPRGILETPIGAVNFTMTEASHVYLNSDGNKGQAVTIRESPTTLPITATSLPASGPPRIGTIPT